MQPPSLGLRRPQHAGSQGSLQGRVVADLDARDLRVFVGLLAGLAAAATVCVARGGGDGVCGSSRTAGAALDAGRWRSCARGDREKTKTERTATARRRHLAGRRKRTALLKYSFACQKSSAARGALDRQKTKALKSWRRDTAETRATTWRFKARFAGAVRFRRHLCGNQNLRRVRLPRHRRDACSMAWRCRFLTDRPSQDGRVIAEKSCNRHTG